MLVFVYGGVGGGVCGTGVGGVVGGALEELMVVWSEE